MSDKILRFKKCSRCRQNKQITLCVRGMHYCEGCESHAPTAAEFDAWLNDKKYATRSVAGEIRRGSTVNVFGRSK